MVRPVFYIHGDVGEGIGEGEPVVRCCFPTCADAEDLAELIFRQAHGAEDVGGAFATTAGGAGGDLKPLGTEAGEPFDIARRGNS